MAQIRTAVFYTVWLVLQYREIQVHPSHLKGPVFISGCSVATGSHNLFARAPEALTLCRRLGHQAVIPHWHVCSCSLSPFTASATYFSVFPEKTLPVLHPIPHPASPLPRGGHFFCADWLSLDSLQPFAQCFCCSLSSVSLHCCILQPNGACRPSAWHYVRLSPIQWHVSRQPKKQRECTRTILNN